MNIIPAGNNVMRCSVVLCTYNGARYLRPQLDSYLGQRVLLDELVVCDDASSDNTHVQLEEFSRRAPFPVRVHINSRNLGLWRNFEKAVGLASGDIIFMSDQDDVWKPDKVRTMRDMFAAETGIGFIVGDAEVVDEGLEPKGYTTWERYGFTRRMQHAMEGGRAFQTLLRHNALTGATMAFRAELRKFMLPLPPQWAYDLWFGAVMSAFTRCRLVREPVNLYRQHASQAVGAFGLGTRAKAAMGITRQTYADNAETFRHLRRRMLDFKAELLDASYLDLIDEKIAFFEARSRLSAIRFLRIPAVLANLAHGRYHRFASGWKSVVKDSLTR